MPSYDQLVNMEAQVIRLLRVPGVSVEVLAGVFVNCSRVEVEDVLFRLFFRFGLDPSLLPVGMGLEDIASLFDQLIDLVADVSLRRVSEATLLVSGGGL